MMSSCQTTEGACTHPEERIVLILEHPSTSYLHVLPGLRDRKVGGRWNLRDFVVGSGPCALLEPPREPLAFLLLRDRLGHEPVIGPSVETLDSSVLAFSLSQ